MPKTFLETGERVEVQHKAEDIDEELSSTPVMAKSAPSFGRGHVVPASIAPGSTLLSLHYSRRNWPSSLGT